MKLVDNNITIDKVLNSTSKTEVTHEDLVISVRYLLGLKYSDERSIYNENYVGGDGYSPSSPNIDLSNYVDIESNQNITGIKTFQNGLIIGTVKIVDDGDGLHIYKGLYSDSFITAYGKNEGGSGSSIGQISYERLDDWSQWKPGETDTYVLSAKLGVDLYNNKLQLATPSTWNDSTYNATRALSASMAVTKFNELNTKIDNSSITINGTSIKLGGTFRTANITAGTIGISSATSGYTLSVPYVTTNTYGVITGYGSHTHTVNNIPNNSLQHSTIGIAGTDVSLGSGINKAALLSNLGLSGTATAWGQTYWNNKPMDISGTLTNVLHILGTGNIEMNGYIQACGALDAGSFLYIRGNDGDYPRILFDNATKWLRYNRDANCLETNVGIVSHSFISAYGINSNGGSSGGATTEEKTENTTVSVFSCDRSGIFLTKGTRYKIYYKAQSSFTSSIPSYTGMLLYTISGKLDDGLDYRVINNVTEAQMQSGVTFEYVAEFDGELAPFTGDVSKSVNVDIEITYNKTTSSGGSSIETVERTETANISVFSCDRSGIILTQGKKYRIYYKALSSFISELAPYTGMILYTISGTLPTGLDHKVINNVTEAQMQNGVTFDYVAEFDGELAPFTGDTTKSVNVEIKITYTETVSNGVTNVSKWKGKNWLSYGDSITEFGYLDPINYQQYVKPAVGFSNSYSRGIGGSSISFLGGGGPVRFINADGSLNYTLRPNDIDYDNFTGTAPSGITKVRSAFCAWSRIKAMIPDNIRNNIDIITLMGGTNDLDYWAEIGNFSTDIPTWISGNRTDPEWAADVQYYNGGDFNIGTFAGAFASTIMKLQTRCPNAMIVVLTPYGWWDTTTKMQHDHDTKKPVSVRITMTDIANLEKKIAEYMGIEVIDVNAKTGINGFNYDKYKRDSVHPNDLGQRAIARVIIEGLNIINPN